MGAFVGLFGGGGGTEEGLGVDFVGGIILEGGELEDGGVFGVGVSDDDAWSRHDILNPIKTLT